MSFVVGRVDIERGDELSAGASSRARLFFRLRMDVVANSDPGDG
ncbi:hypothetical protein [Hyphococcus sp.]